MHSNNSMRHLKIAYAKETQHPPEYHTALSYTKFGVLHACCDNHHRRGNILENVLDMGWKAQKAPATPIRTAIRTCHCSPCVAKLPHTRKTLSQSPNLHELHYRLSVVPLAMAPLNQANVQGDLFSRGFPKYFETYYFFSIVSGKEKEFSKALAVLAKSGQISSLTKVREDWHAIDHRIPGVVIPISNALIALSKSGLDKVCIVRPTIIMAAKLSRFRLACLMLT